VIYQTPDLTLRKKRRRTYMSCKTSAEIEAIGSGEHMQKL
jgi:hypothetical protein